MKRPHCGKVNYLKVADAIFSKDTIVLVYFQRLPDFGRNFKTSP